MATVRAFIRTTKKDNTKVRFRLSDGRDTTLYYVSDIEVNPNHWDKTKEQLKVRAIMPDDVRTKTDSRIAQMKRDLLDVYSNLKDVTPENWYLAIDKQLNPERYNTKDKTFLDYFDDFMEERKERARYLNVLRRCLERWEMYRQITGEQAFKLDLNTLTDKDLHLFNEFLEVEHEIQGDYPELYKAVPETRRVEPRGNNARSDHFNKLRSFFLWANKNRLTVNNPFENFDAPQERYGTPYYITIEERNKLLKTDLSDNPETAVQRDIFIFQCLIGCRVSDLLKLTEANVKGDFIEYIPRKTRDEKPITVRVPLTATALSLIEKYKGGKKLFPYISSQKYNIHIKKAFTLAGIDRLVTILNPTTGEEEQVPINDVASSHLARRAFIGNLYKKVKDPSLVGSLSGHVEGSKAFARYRDIDDEMKKETVNLLE